MSMELKITRRFDKEKYRHYINGWNSVMHCHHYASLYTQLAEDAGELFDGVGILYASAAESFFEVLKDYFLQNNVHSLSERSEIVEQYWAFMGMGKLTITDAAPEKGTAEMPFSHLDAGWIKKWGQRGQSINFITRGYLAAAFAVLHGGQPENYQVTETDSIVTGKEKSRFVIQKQEGK